MRRYLRIIGTPVTLLLLLGFLLYGGWWGYTNLMAPVVSTPTPCATQSVGAKLTSSKVTVRVLNGGTEVGLASRVGAQLKNAGFRVVDTSNTDASVNQTVIVGAAASDPEVRLVAGFFKKATVKGDHRVDHSVDVMVGDNYGGMNTGAPRSIAVKGGSVCLPASAGASGSASATKQP